MTLAVPLRFSTTLWKKGRALTEEQVLSAIEAELRRWYGVEPLRLDGAVHADLPLVRRGARSLNQWFSGPTFGEVREVDIDVHETHRGFTLVVSVRQSALPSLLFTISALVVALSLHASVLVSTAIGAAVALLSWATGWMALGTGVQVLRNRCDAALGPAGRLTSA
jgi:hypothetical protein